MKGIEVLAIMSTCGAIGAGIGLANEFDDEAVARSKAVTAQYCEEAYDNDNAVTKDTIKCLEQGWVMEGKAVPNANTMIVAGEPSRLLEGYVALEQSRGRHFEGSTTIWLTLGGGAVGAFLAYQIETQEAKEEKRKISTKRNESVGPAS